MGVEEDDELRTLRLLALQQMCENTAVILEELADDCKQNDQTGLAFASFMLRDSLRAFAEEAARGINSGRS
jgi:hypothetical protein